LRAALLLLASSLLASPALSREIMVRMEHDAQVVTPVNWARVATPKPSDTTKLMFVLKTDSEARDKLENIFWAVSDPQNPEYGNHLTVDEITAITQPSQESRSKVVEYLVANGVERDTITISRNGNLVSARVAIRDAEEMLSTKFSIFQHNERMSKFVVRADSDYHLPASIADSVAFVENVIRFPSVPSVNKVEVEADATLGADSQFSACGRACSGMVTPEVLKARYSLGNAPTTVTGGNSVAVAEFQGEYWIPSDLTHFASTCQTAPFTVNSTTGGNHASKCSGWFADCTESMLDVEYLGAIAEPIPMDVIYSDSYNLLDWVESVASDDDTALIHSVSYGNDEAQQTGSAFMESVNTEFMKMGARGISIMVASGDQGVWGREGHGSKFHPDFPGGSPYVTAVGGTNFVKKSVIGDEEAWSSSGGGFSDEFARPSFQDAAVKEYLATANLPNTKYFTATGRGYPDISALGGQTNPYCVLVDGSWGGVAGTSASCPVAAGVFSKLNEVRMAAGGKPLGFLNPFIYQNPSGFNDVKSGKNNDGRGAGFDATKGWDPATGLGTPNFEALAKVV